MSDKDMSRRFRSTEFGVLRKLLQLPMYQPLLEDKPLPVRARLCIALGFAALWMAALLPIARLAFERPPSATDLATAAAFLMGLAFANAANTFGIGPAPVIARLIDVVQRWRRKSEFDRRCERIGRSLDLRTDYLTPRVKIWLSHFVRAHALSSQPEFVRKLASRTTQLSLWEMELAEKLEAAIENGTTDPASALRIVLRECRWMDPNGIEQAVLTGIPAVA